MNTITALHNQKEIQVHQWRVAQWISEIPRSDYIFSKIKIACRDIDTRPYKSSKPQRIDPYKLLLHACGSSERFTPSEIHIGILREALNAVNRIMLSEIKAIRGT